jgi:Sec-independent protein translocase protein TatA
MGRSMGRGLREFKSSVTGDESEDSLTGDELKGSESDDELEDPVTSKERDADTDLDLRTIRLDGRRAA